MAHHQLAYRYERKAQGSFYCCPRAGRRRATAADQGQGSATSARGGGLAHRRTQDVGREEIPSRQPAGEDRPAHLGGHHQGTMGLRAGAPATERRTRSRSLRGPILAGSASSRAHDDDRLRLPPASSACSSKTGKKESTDLRLSQLCPPCAKTSSNSSLDCRRSDARIVENGFAASSGVSKSAKVVLASVAKRIRSMGRLSTQSAPRRATRSSRSPGGVPAARASGARSRCGVRAEDMMARKLGESSDDMAKRSRRFLRVRDMANAGDTLLHLTPRDIDLARPRQIMPV